MCHGTPKTMACRRTHLLDLFPGTIPKHLTSLVSMPDSHFPENWLAVLVVCLSEVNDSPLSLNSEASASRPTHVLIMSVLRASSRSLTACLSSAETLWRSHRRLSFHFLALPCCLHNTVHTVGPHLHWPPRAPQPGSCGPLWLASGAHLQTLFTYYFCFCHCFSLPPQTSFLSSKGSGIYYCVSPRRDFFFNQFYLFFSTVS